MSEHKIEMDWVVDFNEFMSIESSLEVPSSVSKSIFDSVYKGLNPSAWLVFLKLMLIHTIVGTASLAICNQFGMNPFNTSLSLSQYFMKFGHSTCMFLCGVVFVSFSFLLTRYLIGFDEFRTLRKNSFVQALALSALSLAVFLILGAEMTLKIAVLWLLGAMIGGAIGSNLRPIRFPLLR